MRTRNPEAQGRHYAVRLPPTHTLREAVAPLSPNVARLKARYIWGRCQVCQVADCRGRPFRPLAPCPAQAFPGNTNFLSGCLGIPHYHVRPWIAIHGKIVASDRFCAVSPPQTKQVVTGPGAGQSCPAISRYDFEIAGHRNRDENRMAAAGWKHAWWGAITGRWARQVPGRDVSQVFRRGGGGAGSLVENRTSPLADVKNEPRIVTLTLRGPWSYTVRTSSYQWRIHLWSSG